MHLMSQENQDKFDRACSLVSAKAFDWSAPEIKLSTSFNFIGKNRYLIQTPPEPKEVKILLAGDLHIKTGEDLSKMSFHRYLQSPTFCKIPKVKVERIKQAVRRTMIKKQILNRLLSEMK